MDKTTNRLSVSRSCHPSVNHVSGNTQHGRKCRKPAKQMGPKRVLVIQIFDWCPLHYIEDKHTLFKKQKLDVIQVGE